MTNSKDSIVLTKEQALSMLGDDEQIHTFRSSPVAMIGCDWSRASIVEAINANECELGGPACQSMNHGLVIHVNGPLFVECKAGFDYAKFEEGLTAEVVQADEFDASGIPLKTLEQL